MKEIFNIKELSVFLNVSVSTLRQYVRENKIPHFRIGNRILFRANSIEHWLEMKEENEARKSIYY